MLSRSEAQRRHVLFAGDFVKNTDMPTPAATACHPTQASAPPIRQDTSQPYEEIPMPDNVLEQFNLKGKVAIVTGATRGIGEAIARGLAQCGARVVITGRKPDAVESVAASFRSEGLEGVPIAAHMGDSGAIAALVEKTLSECGGIDVIVNNAATNPVYGPLLEAGPDAFDKIMNVNIRGPLELAKAAHKSMAERGGGSVINISSVGGMRPEPYLGLYSVSKAALISLTKVMAQEWGRDGIRVNAICPGLIQTHFSSALWQNEKLVKQMEKMLPLGRIGQPNEIVPLAVFLASPASSYCTGSTFIADGGHTI